MIGRFAPTPSGRLHLGNLLCAMLAYLSARSQGGQFLLRIEDVDIPRCPRALAQQAIDDLRFLGFRWDAPPLYQSERSGVYQDVLNRLRREGHVYPCFCTRAQLHATVAESGRHAVHLPRHLRAFDPGGSCRARQDPCACHASACAG